MNLFPSSHFNILWWSITLLFSSVLCYKTTQTQCPPESGAYFNVLLRQGSSLTPPSPDPSLPISVLSKDVPINHSTRTWVRIFLPHNVLSSKNKLPLVVFFHGGGFVANSAASTIFHDFCFNMAHDLGAVVVSLNYRLAPGHRLPAAYDDAVEALHWIKTRPDGWLSQHADYSRCYLMGSSAGGNMAYYVGLRVADQVKQLEPLKIRGLIPVQPFFGGVQRTGSELRLINDTELPLCVTDMLWKWSLPKGADRDHEYSNPMVGEGPKRSVEKIRRRGWRVLVTGTEGDPLVDRGKELVKMMEEEKVNVVGYFTPGGYHGIQDHDLQKAKELYSVVKNFMSPSTSTAYE